MRASPLECLRMRADGGVDSRCLSGFRDRNPAVWIAERVYIIRPQPFHDAFGEIGNLVRHAAQNAGSPVFRRVRQGHRRDLRRFLVVPESARSGSDIECQAR
jgi:hypothetical protein